MNRQTGHHGCKTAPLLCLVIAVTLGLVSSRQAAAAKECHRETPLPPDVRLMAPDPEVPEALARFAGVWNGASERPRRGDPLCHTLVVEAVEANGDARVLYSYSSSDYWNIPLPGFLRATGRIVNGVLRLRVPFLGRYPRVAYWWADETLEGTFEDIGPLQGFFEPSGPAVLLRLTRVTDLHQVGCRPPAGEFPPAPPAPGPRDRLTAAELLGAEAGPGLVHNAYFLPRDPAAPALHPFQGTVTVQDAPMGRSRHGCPVRPAAVLPGFTVAFFTHGEHLVPVVRDLLAPSGLILSPGRVWSEPGDGGLSRASFPFVLTGPYENETRHGLATFLYDDTRVTGLQFQVVQENVPWRDKYDGWGQAAMTYAPGPIAQEEALRAQFVAELQQQIPIRPWSALAAVSGAPVLAGFDGDTAPDDLKVSGVILDGVLYLRGCETRAGPYPYCREMRHGVFSVTKSLAAAVALLRLAQTYGEQVFALKITEYVPVTASHDGWARVTFDDALNMATGIGEQWPHRAPTMPFADTPTKLGQFFRAQTAQDKLDLAFSFGQYPWGPGEVLRYNNLHTFVLAAAMDSFLKRQAGPHAQLWDMVVAEVFQPLGIVHAPMRHTQEAEGRRGIPHLLHGLYPTVDDLAKLTTLLQNGGQHQGRQVLSAAPLAAALSQTAARGLPSGQENRFGAGRYYRSFWTVPYRTATGCSFQIPYMIGGGGQSRGAAAQRHHGVSGR